MDELLGGVERPEGLLGDKGLMKELKVRLMERMLGAELTEHLGYEPHGAPASQQSNRRNGATRKVLKGNDGAVPIDIPRVTDAVLAEVSDTPGIIWKNRALEPVYPIHCPASPLARFACKP